MNELASLPWASLAAWMAAAFLIGSFPTGYLMCRFLTGTDIRKQGSGNPGATNVFRVVGKGPGIATLLIDGLKGFAPTYLALRQVPEPKAFACLVGLAAIAGHNWSVFLNFRGGKGVATSGGVFFALAPGPALVSIAFFLAALLATGHVSVGSMAGAVALSASTWLFTRSKLLTGLSIFCAALVFYLHRKNIGRLARHEEPKIDFGGQRAPGTHAP